LPYPANKQEEREEIFGFGILDLGFGISLNLEFGISDLELF